MGILFDGKEKIDGNWEVVPSELGLLGLSLENSKTNGEVVLFAEIVGIALIVDTNEGLVV